MTYYFDMEVADAVEANEMLKAFPTLKVDSIDPATPSSIWRVVGDFDTLLELSSIYFDGSGFDEDEMKSHIKMAG